MSLHEYGLDVEDIAAIEELNKSGVKTSFIKQLLMKSHVKGFREGIAESLSIIGTSDYSNQVELR